MLKVKKTKGKKLSVTQIASGIGKKYDQVQTLKGLGLGKMHRTRVLEDTPSIRGMIKKIQHLVFVKTENIN